MPYTVQTERRGFAFVLTGVVTEAEIKAANASMWGAENWDELRFQIWNLLEAERLDLSEIDSKAYAYMDRAASQSSPRMKVAFIATDPEIIKICEAYIATLDIAEWEGQMFRTAAAADAWARSVT